MPDGDADLFPNASEANISISYATKTEEICLNWSATNKEIILTAETGFQSQACHQVAALFQQRQESDQQQ